jgi:hypothetical protein
VNLKSPASNPASNALNAFSSNGFNLSISFISSAFDGLPAPSLLPP